jgi:hypothetical protein
MTLTPEPMLQLNVCSLGWVINSNTVRSVVCVSLSFPESANRWDRWKDPPTGTGSSRWRDPTVPVLDPGLTERYGPLVGLSRPRGQDHIPLPYLRRDTTIDGGTLRYHIGQKQDKEYWVSKELEVSMICGMIVWLRRSCCRATPCLIASTFPNTKFGFFWCHGARKKRDCKKTLGFTSNFVCRKRVSKWVWASGRSVRVLVLSSPRTLSTARVP